MTSRRGQQLAHRVVRGIAQQLSGLAQLYEPALAQYRDAIPQQQRFRHVVGDEHTGEMQIPADVLEGLLQTVPAERIQCAEGLIEQQDAGPCR